MKISSAKLAPLPVFSQTLDVTWQDAYLLFGYCSRKLSHFKTFILKVVTPSIGSPKLLERVQTKKATDVNHLPSWMANPRCF